MWVPNTTFGINLAVRSLLAELEPGDEVLGSSLEYGATRVLLEALCERLSLRYVEPRIALPLEGDAEGALLDAMTERTRLMIVSHIASDASVRLPVERICAIARASGVTTIVDGAHGPGQLDLELDRLDCDVYVDDLHKWLCAPRPSGMLYARPAVQARLDPLVVSLGGVDRRRPLSERQEYIGTTDPSNWLAVPAALDFHERYLAGEAARCSERLIQLDAEMRDVGCTPVAPLHDERLMMRAWLLPAGSERSDLTVRLRENHDVEVQIAGPVIRVSVAWYTEEEEIERLLSALRIELGRAKTWTSG